MSENIGAMRARVALQSPVRSSDAIGGAALSWTDEAEVWAEIVAGGVAQGADFDTAPSVSGYTMTINRLDGLRAGWRVLWSGRVFAVRGVRDEGAARVQLICEEEVL